MYEEILCKHTYTPHQILSEVHLTPDTPIVPIYTDMFTICN